MDRLEQLLERQFEGATTPDEQAEIVALLRDPAARLRWGRGMRMVGGLASSRQHASAAGSAWRRPLIWISATLAAAAAVAIAVYGGFAAQVDPGAARIVAVGEDAAVDGVPASVEEAIRHGQHASGAMTVVLADGSRLASTTGSRFGFALGLHGARLDQGVIAVEAAPQHGDTRLTIHSPHARTTVRGTRFRVETGAGSDLVAVSEGQVEVAPPSGVPALIAAGGIARSDGLAVATGSLAPAVWSVDLAQPPPGWRGRRAEGGLLADRHERLPNGVEMYAIFGGDGTAPGFVQAHEGLEVVIGYDAPAIAKVAFQLMIIGTMQPRPWRANLQADVELVPGRGQALRLPWSAFLNLIGAKDLGRSDDVVGRFLMLSANGDQGVVLRSVAIGPRQP